ETPKLAPESRYGMVALHPSIRTVANAYFGMNTQLRFYNVWLSRPSGGELQSSQLWHRDREDFHILKIFIYLRDVGHGAGPLRYATGTHRGRDRELLPGRTADGSISRTTDAQLAKVV